jgi:hypothetical protein
VYRQSLQKIKDRDHGYGRILWMKTRDRIFLFILSGMLWLNACSSMAISGSNKPTPIVVRILDLDTISKTLTTLERSSYTPVITAEQVVSTPTQIPFTLTRTPSETKIPSPTSCTNQAEFIKSLTINDNTVLEGNQSFTKIWRIENVGTCTWSTSYSLVFSSGETMGGALSNPLLQEVKPGETIDLRLDLIAPSYAQPYTGNWMFQDPAGNQFGVGGQSNQPLAVTIVVKPPVIQFHT